MENVDELIKINGLDYILFPSIIIPIELSDMTTYKRKKEQQKTKKKTKNKTKKNIIPQRLNVSKWLT